MAKIPRNDKIVKNFIFDSDRISSVLGSIKGGKTWVMWKAEQKKNGSWTKPPYQTNEYKASPTDPKDWTTFDQAITCLRADNRFDGIGHVITSDSGEVWIDLDHVRNPDTGKILPWAEAIVSAAGSYTEVSPSGDGLHVGLRGTLSEGCNFNPGNGLPHAEIYNSGRYFTITAKTLESSPDDLVANQAGVDFAYGYIQARKALSSYDLSEDAVDKIMNPPPEGQRSEAGASIIMTLTNAGADDDQIKSVFDQFPIGDKYREKGVGKSKWLQGEIDRARGAAGNKKSIHKKGKENPRAAKPDYGIKTSDRLPLIREAAPPAAFPMDALPGELKSLVEQVTHAVQCPVALIGNSLLAAISLVTQSFINVSVDGRTFPTSLFLLSVAKSGERKSTVDEIFMAPIQTYERKAIDKYSGDMRAFESTQFAFTERRKAIIKNCGKNADEISRKILELGAAPEPPPGRGIIAKDITMPGLFAMLKTGCPSLGIFTSEGGSILGGYSMSKDNKTQTVSHMAALWDGACIPIARAGDGFQYLYGKRLAAHLMIQPVLLDALFQDKIISGQGILSRFLSVWPDSTIGDRPYQAENIREYPLFKRYFAHLSELLEQPKPFRDGSTTELDPALVMLSPEAKQSYVNFYNDTEKAMRKGGQLEFITGFGSKVPENALRIAACLEFWGDPNEVEISIDSMDSAVELMWFYISEMLRIVDQPSVEQCLSDSERVLQWVKDRGGIFSLPDLIQKGPSFVRSREKAVQIIAILEEHCLITRKDPQKIDGKNRKDVWSI